MYKTYKLIGFINLFDIVPDFVYPIFENGGQFYFQHGKSNHIEEFVRVKHSVYDRIIPVPSDSSIFVSLVSKPIYAFQYDINHIEHGTAEQLSAFLNNTQTEDLILKNEIDEFFNEISSNNDFLYQPSRPYSYGTGRRKSAVARVRIYPNGSGAITINNRSIDDYFSLESLRLFVRQPMITTKTLETVDLIATVSGGGVTGQAGAIQHGVARALLGVDPQYRTVLKAAGLLTRDPRMKERKKYGLKAARRAPQFSKR